MWRRRIDSFKYAFKGLATLFKTQPNAKFHLFATLMVVLAGVSFNITLTEWCLIIFAIIVVISAEAFNTALEFLTDLVSPEYHDLAGKTKDVAAAGVLVTAIGALLIGIIIFGHRILDLIQSLF